VHWPRGHASINAPTPRRSAARSRRDSREQAYGNRLEGSRPCNSFAVHTALRDVNRIPALSRMRENPDRSADPGLARTRISNDTGPEVTGAARARRRRRRDALQTRDLARSQLDLGRTKREESESDLVEPAATRKKRIESLGKEKTPGESCAWRRRPAAGAAPATRVS